MVYYQYISEADPPDQYFRSPVRESSSTAVPEYWNKGGHMGSSGGGTWRARAYNGGLGAEPLAGSRGRAPFRGRS